MKLFLFDHCPYCIRALMVANYHQLSIQEVYLQNHDTQARIEKVDKNTVPILETQSGDYLAESLDIITYLNSLSHHNSLLPAQYQTEIQQLQQELEPNMYPLIFPRWLKIPLPEFQCEEATAWFTRNKSPMINESFEAAFANSAHYRMKLNATLANFTALSLPSERHNKLNYDDVFLFPLLRNLTVIAQVQWTPRLKQYLNEVSQLTHISLYDDVAL